MVGVGGGVLPMQLHRHCGAAVHAVELDSTVLDLARRHFGFTESATPPTLKVRQLSLEAQVERVEQAV